MPNAFVAAAFASLGHGRRATERGDEALGCYAVHTCQSTSSSKAIRGRTGSGVFPHLPIVHPHNFVLLAWGATPSFQSAERAQVLARTPKSKDAHPACIVRSMHSKPS